MKRRRAAVEVHPRNHDGTVLPRTIARCEGGGARNAPVSSATEGSSRFDPRSRLAGRADGVQRGVVEDRAASAPREACPLLAWILPAPESDTRHVSRGSRARPRRLGQLAPVLIWGGGLIDRAAILAEAEPFESRAGQRAGAGKRSDRQPAPGPVCVCPGAKVPPRAICRGVGSSASIATASERKHPQHPQSSRMAPLCQRPARRSPSRNQ